MEVSEKWLQNYIKAKYAEVPRQVQVSEKKHQYDSQVMRRRSYVGKKDSKQWVWLALDIKTREIVGVYIGDRSKEAAKGLWISLPPVPPMCCLLSLFYDSGEIIKSSVV